MQKFRTDSVSQPRSAYYFGKFALTSENIIILPHSVRETIVKSTSQIWVVTHQYGISILNPQTSFCRKTSGGTLEWAPAFLLFISTEHR